MRIDVRTVRSWAEEAPSPGTYMPTVGTGAVEYRRLVTTSWLASPANANSMPPAVSGEANAAATMLSKAMDSRGLSRKNAVRAVAGQGLPMKHRYVAVTSNGSVYEVLNARTSE